MDVATGVGNFPEFDGDSGVPNEKKILNAIINSLLEQAHPAPPFDDELIAKIDFLQWMYRESLPSRKKGEKGRAQENLSEFLGTGFGKMFVQACASARQDPDDINSDDIQQVMQALEKIEAAYQAEKRHEAVKDKKIQSIVDKLQGAFPVSRDEWGQIVYEISQGHILGRKDLMWPFAVAAMISSDQALPCLTTREGLRKIAKRLTAHVDHFLSPEQQVMLSSLFGSVSEGDLTSQKPDIVLCSSKNLKQYTKVNDALTVDARHRAPLVVVVPEARQKILLPIEDWGQRISEFAPLVEKNGYDREFEYGKDTYIAAFKDGQPQLFILGPATADLKDLHNNFDAIVLNVIFRGSSVLKIGPQIQKKPSAKDIERLAETFPAQRMTKEARIENELGEIFPHRKNGGAYVSHLAPGAASVLRMALGTAKRILMEKNDHPMFRLFHEKVATDNPDTKKGARRGNPLRPQVNIPPAV